MREHDDAYAALIALHEGREDIDIHRLNVQLILLLGNEVADWSRVLEIVRQVAAMNSRI